MKLRKGFVSNSSSSSFIIGIKESVPCTHCGRSDIDILELIEKEDDYGMNETTVDAVGIEAVMEGLKEWDYLEPKELKKVVAEMKELSADHKIAMISLSYHSEALNKLFQEAKNIKIIWETG